MKSWLLYFFAVFIGVSVVPFAAASTQTEANLPTVSVFQNGGINELSCEDYALQVLLAAGKSVEESESLKALAVSSRSAALYLSLYGCKHEDFDVCADKNCCFPLSSPETADESYLEKCKAALRETYGLGLGIDGLPAMALFTLCAGSSTADCKEFTYLTAVAEASRCEIHKEAISLTAEELKPEIDLESVKNNSFLIYDDRGKCDFGVFGGKLLSGFEIADMLSLRSTEFTLSFTDNGIDAESFGIGNGYGLNLCGADIMAKNGKNYQEILSFYYPNLTTEKFYSDFRYKLNL